jgi:hypothetical protein
MDEKQRRRSKEFIAIGVVLILVIIGVAGYFLYYKKTPTYSLNLIRESVEKHDWETFNAHVDTDSVLSGAFDAFLDEGMGDAKNDDSIKQMVNGFAKLVKPAIVSALKDDIKKFVETGTVGTKNQESGSSDKQDAKVNTDGIKKSADWDGMKFKGVAYTKKADNGIATVGVTLTDAQLGQDFTLNIDMRQLQDGTWQVIELSNLKDYLKAIEKAKKDKLAELNQPLQDQINQVINIKSTTAMVVSKDPYGFSKTLKVQMSVAYNSDKRIVSVRGVVSAMLAGDDKPFEIPFDIKIKDQSIKNGNMWVAKDLNGFIPSQAKFLQAAAGTIQSSVQITGITYADDSKLELYKELPKD